MAGLKAQVLERIEILEKQEREREELLSELSQAMESRGYATEEQAHSDLCEGTQPIDRYEEGWLTNDVPGCPNKGGLLSGTDSNDLLDGKDGDDEIRGLAATDFIDGGGGNDVIYGGPGDDLGLNGNEGDDVVYGGDGDDEELYGDHDYGDQGEDVIYGGDGNDTIYAWNDGQRDRVYCGEGIDHYAADKFDYVDGSCEKEGELGGGIA